jgi:hypothetical protein
METMMSNESKRKLEAEKLAGFLEQDWQNLLAHVAAGRGPDATMERTVKQVIAFLRSESV